MKYLYLYLPISNIFGLTWLSATCVFVLTVRVEHVEVKHSVIEFEIYLKLVFILQSNRAVNLAQQTMYLQAISKIIHYR